MTTMSPDNKVKVGAIFRRYRRAARLTQFELAQRSGLEASCPYLIEKGLRGMSLDTYLRLAHGLGLAPDKLMTEILEVLK